MAPVNTNLPRANLRFFVPITNGTVTAVTSLGASSTQVIGQNQTNRTEITFHNPNTGTNANIAVCPATDVNGNALTAAIGGGGSFVIFPGADRTFRGECGMAWNAIASAPGSGLTIIETCLPSSDS